MNTLATFSGWLGLVLIAVVVTASLLLINAFQGRQGKMAQEPQSSKPTVRPVSPAQQTALTASVPPKTSPSSTTQGLKTYVETEYHLSFNHPETWLIEGRREPPVGKQLASFYFDVTTGVADENGQQSAGFAINVYSNPRSLTLPNWVRDNIPVIEIQPSDKPFGDALEVLEVTYPTGFWLVRTNTYIYSFAWSPASTFNIMSDGSSIPSTIHFTD